MKHNPFVTYDLIQKHLDDYDSQAHALPRSAPPHLQQIKDALKAAQTEASIIANACVKPGHPDSTLLIPNITFDIEKKTPTTPQHAHIKLHYWYLLMTFMEFKETLETILTETPASESSVSVLNDINKFIQESPLHGKLLRNLKALKADQAKKGITTVSWKTHNTATPEAIEHTLCLAEALQVFIVLERLSYPKDLYFKEALNAGFFDEDNLKQAKATFNRINAPHKMHNDGTSRGSKIHDFYQSYFHLSKDPNMFKEIFRYFTTNFSDDHTSFASTFYTWCLKKEYSRRWPADVREPANAEAAISQLMAVFNDSKESGTTKHDRNWLMETYLENLFAGNKFDDRPLITHYRAVMNLQKLNITLSDKDLIDLGTRHGESYSLIEHFDTNKTIVDLSEYDLQAMQADVNAPRLLTQARIDTLLWLTAQERPGNPNRRPTTSRDKLTEIMASLLQFIDSQYEPQPPTTHHADDHNNRPLTKNEFIIRLIDAIINIKNQGAEHTRPEEEIVKEISAKIALATFLLTYSREPNNHWPNPSFATQHNIDQLEVYSEDPSNLIKILSVFHTFVMLQTHIDALFKHASILEQLTLRETKELIDELPPHMLSAGVFEEIIATLDANIDLPRDEASALVHGRILALHNAFMMHNQPPAEIQPRLNTAQSTHTASVHESVSKSATQLQKYFQKKKIKITPSTTLGYFLKELQALSNNPPSTLTHAEITAAISALKKIIANTTNPALDYTDRTSQVKTTELLTMAVLSLEDDALRTFTGKTGVKTTTPANDARDKIITCLYDVQRGYNMDEQYQDMGGDDSPICTAGTFNKIMESMQGVVHCVEIRIITKEIAMAALQTIIVNQTRDYLLKQPNDTDEDKNTLQTLLTTLEEEGTANPLFKAIQIKVLQQFASQFKSLYGNQPVSVMQDVVNNAIPYTALNEAFFADIKKQLAKKTQPSSPTLFSTSPPKKPDPSPSPYPPRTNK